MHVAINRTYYFSASDHFCAVTIHTLGKLFVKGISIVTGQIEIHSLLHSLRIPSYPARRCCIPKEAVRHYTVLDTSPKKSCASVIPGWSPCVASVSLYTTLSEREGTFPRSPCAWWFMLRKVPEGRSVPGIFEDPVVKRARQVCIVHFAQLD